MTTIPLPEVPLRSALALTRRWVALLSTTVFGARSLWLAWVGTDGCMLPLVVPIDDLPDVPDAAVLDGLLQLHDTVVEARLGDGGHFALALCRPGQPDITEADEEWAEALRLRLDDEYDGTWSLHVAAGGRVTPLVEPLEWAWPSA